MKRIQYFLTTLLITILSLMPDFAAAQCAMCRASAQNSNIANGINSGVLYLLLFPFLVIFGGGIFWYFNKEKFKG
jgi:hypothetical protein